MSVWSLPTVRLSPDAASEVAGARVQETAR